MYIGDKYVYCCACVVWALQFSTVSKVEDKTYEVVLLVRSLCNACNIIQWCYLCTGRSLFAVACPALLTLRRWETPLRDSVATPTRLTLYVPRTSSLTTPYRWTWLEGRWPHLTYWMISGLSSSKTLSRHLKHSMSFVALQ